MNNYLQLLDDIVVDFLKDIKSLRYQLVLGAFVYNIWLFKHSADVAVQLAAIGLLTLVYGMYFQSKRHQAEMQAKQKGEQNDPPIEREP